MTDSIRPNKYQMRHVYEDGNDACIGNQSGKHILEIYDEEDVKLGWWCCMCGKSFPHEVIKDN